MARRRRKAENHPGELNLTAMIDVAFQLLSFFLLAIKPVDVFANLDAFRPSPEKPSPGTPMSPMIKIMVLPQNPGESGTYVVNEVTLTTPQMEKKLQRYAETDPTQTILIMCAKRSTHKQLVDLLDKCAKYKLTNLSVVSSAGI
jgi:biopolymer transport protein ExbD